MVHSPISSFALTFCRGLKHLKKRPPSASISNRDFPLSSKPEDVARLVYAHYKV